MPEIEIEDDKNPTKVKATTEQNSELEQKQDNSDTTQQEIAEYAASIVEEINRLDSEVGETKKQIILRFAKFLEDKIRTDQIAAEIVHQLKDIASERWVHKCLKEYPQYKNQQQSKNASKKSQNTVLPIPQQSSLTDRDLLRASELKKELEPRQMIAPTANGAVIIEEGAPDAGNESSNTDISGHEDKSYSDKSEPIKDEFKIDTSKTQEATINPDKFQSSGESTTETESKADTLASIEPNLTKFQFTLDYNHLKDSIAKLHFLRLKEVCFEGTLDIDTGKVIVEFCDDQKQISFKKDLEQSEDEQVQECEDYQVKEELEKSATKNSKKIVRICPKHGEFYGFCCFGCLTKEESGGEAS
ncbi:MAG: hypothetical protein WBF33_15825 [Candidatus Nitrosopolaris sp.]|jgi:hypothetical protein